MLDRLVSFRLARISNGLSLFTARIYGGDHGINLLDWRIISTLKYKPNSTPVEIVKGIDADKGNVSRSLIKLENKGLVVRIHDSTGKRKVSVTLTEQGNAVFEKINPIARARERHLLSVLNKAELEQLEVILDKLVTQVARINEAIPRIK